MSMRNIKLILIFVFICFNLPGFSQADADTAVIKTDSIPVFDSISAKGVFYNTKKGPPLIELTTEQAIKVLQQWYRPNKWNDINNPFRKALGQLLAEAVYPAFDSTENFLKKYPYDSISVPWDKFYIWEPLKIKIPTIIMPAHAPDSIASAGINNLNVSDTLKPSDLDFARKNTGVLPVAGLKDTTILIIIDTLNSVNSKYAHFPFKEYSYPFQSDSIKYAIESLMKYVEAKDSSIVNFSGVGSAVTPIWLNSKSDMMTRYWLKNDMNDSITVWIGSTSRNTIGLYLEKGVNFRKPVKTDDVFSARIDIKPQDRSKLLAVQKIATKKQFWKYKSETSFLFSQSALSNWVKGGENSIAMALDVTGYANYNNPTVKLSSNNFARLKFGFLASGGNPMRKNLDLLETNSKLNHKAFGKFDFSAIMLFKTQLARGYTYKKTPSGADTSIIVSKFFNPAILTMGIGLDYKPNKTTSLNLSPLSYKGTFVLDTALIDEQKYGILKGRTSKIEPGASFMLTNTFKPLSNVSITNRLQLFTNYINNPQNIDVDWEIIAVASLNWFTEVRLNTHLIFDDDTKTTLMEGGHPTSRKTSRIQFKEMLGFSFIFKF